MPPGAARGGAGSSFARPAQPGGAPSYYLPGSMIADPNYAKKKQAFDIEAQHETSRNAALDRGAQNFISLANGKRNVSAQFTDPRTGLALQYNPQTGGGSGTSGSGDDEYEDFDFNASLAKVQRALPNRPSPAQMPGRVVGASPADSAAAEASEFGRAKDRIGRLGRGSMTALSESFDSRGFGGSNMEAGATTNLLSDLQGQQGEVIRDQTIQNLARRRQVEDRNYAGDINQRGQDIGFTTTTRGQDIGAETARSQMQVPLLQLIAANRKRRLY